MTSQGELLRFTVADNAVTFLEFDYRLENFACVVRENVTLSLHPPKPLTGTGFVVNINVGGGVTSLLATVSGSFISHTEAGGTLALHYSQVLPLTPCLIEASPTWTAHKVSATLLQQGSDPVRSDAAD